MVELVLLGHFFVVAALSHYCGGLWNLIRLPHVVALPRKLWRVLHDRAGLWIGGFHRLGSRLLDCVDHPRCSGRESRVAGANLACVPPVRHLQRGLGTAARVVAGTRIGATPHPGALFRRFYFDDGVDPVAGAVAESLWEFRRAVASSRSPLLRVFSGVAGGQRRGSRIRRALWRVCEGGRGDCVLRNGFWRLAVAAICRAVSRGRAEPNASTGESPTQQCGAAIGNRRACVAVTTSRRRRSQ